MDEVIKPYEFRKLKATDLFLVVKLVTKLGLNNITNACGNDISKFVELSVKNGEERKAVDDAEYASVGVAVINIAQVVLERLGECEEEIYKLLEATSNMSIDEIKELDIAVFIAMIKDFVTQEQFSQLFTQAVSLISTAQ